MEGNKKNNRIYLTVNVHIETEFWSLGLVRVVGSLPVENG
jgi:hypothetical protein